MPITGEHAGRRYPPTEPYEVSTAKIAEFARAIGDPSPVYSGPDAIAPPTFVAVISATAWEQMFDDPELGLALRRIVHGDQRFSYQRPLRSGDRVQAVLTIEKVRNRDTTDMISSSVAVSTVQGEPICTAQATFFHSHPPEADPADADRVRRDGPVTAADARKLAVGDSLPPLTVHLTRADLVRYAGASTDFNPIHYSERFAAQVGLPGVIAHGLLTMAVALRVVTDWTQDPAGVRSYFVRFTRPVVVPDDDQGAEVTVTATVTAVQGPRVSFGIDAVCDGQKVLGAARADIDLAR